VDELDEILGEINIFFVRQKEQKGLGDAVRYAESFVDDEPFALLLGDTITLPPCTKELIQVYSRYKTSIVAVEEVPIEKVSLYGVVKCKEVEASVYLIEDLVEKPSIDEAPSNLAILGRYILTPEIDEARERRRDPAHRCYENFEYKGKNVCLFVRR